MKTYRVERVAGSFYKSSTNELKRQIRECFLNKNFGPVNEPIVEKTDEFMAFIVPHAGYDYSGPCAANAYRKIGENKKPEIIVILGPNHNSIGVGAALYPEGLWTSPLGNLTVDEKFNLLLEEESSDFIIDELSHSQEHSIEVQLPFIRYVFPEATPKIVPICVNAPGTDTERLKALGNALFKAWQKSGKRVLFIASSDLTHAGPSYGFIPTDRKDESFSRFIKNLDIKVINKLLELDIDGAANLMEKQGQTICGINGIFVLLQVLRNMKSKHLRGTVLKHYTSGEITKDYTNIVDYASIQFKHEEE